MLPLRAAIKNLINYYQPSQPAATIPESKSMQIQREKIPVKVENVAPLDKVVHIGKISGIHEVSGTVWSCVDKISEPDDGVIYKFKLRKDYDFITEKSDQRQSNYQEQSKELFPALEIVDRATLALLNPDTPQDVRENVILRQLYWSAGRIEGDPKHPERSSNPSNWRREEYLNELKPLVGKVEENLRLLNRLGFKVHLEKNPGMFSFLFDNRGVYLFSPDRETLLFRWEQERQLNPNLPQLSIQDSAGIVDDLTFVQNFLDHGVTMSHDKEFVHDVLAHVLPYIQCILNSTIDPSRNIVEEFKILKTGIRTFVDNCLNAERLIERGEIDVSDDFKAKLAKNKEQLHTLIGAWVDTISSGREMTSQNKEICGDPIRNILLMVGIQYDWEKYFDKRFNTKVELQPLMDLLKTLNSLGANKEKAA